jgi:tetraacyldisaccharide 4'-kinase
LSFVIWDLNNSILRREELKNQFGSYKLPIGHNVEVLDIKKKIESVMRSSDQSCASPVASALYGISTIYGAAQKLRAGCYRQKILPSRRLPCRVISVGNITVGGTGKTPMTIFLAQKLKQAGCRVAILSRGYKGGAERQGGIVSDGNCLLMDSQRAGDEPFMMAGRLKDIPVIVGKKRFEAGRLAVSKFQPDVIVLDDAFQHLQLKRDIDIVLLDHDQPFGNTHLLPRGILREPLTAMKRATACILTRCPDDANETAQASIAAIKSILPATPVFKSSSEPYCYTVKEGALPSIPAASNFSAPRDLKDHKTRKVFGFSGIARNDDFQRTVKTLGFNVTGFLEFSDHHRYAEPDLQTIVRTAGESGARQLITTEKDYARLTTKGACPMDLVVVGVRAAFQDDGQDFITFIQDRL